MAQLTKNPILIVDADTILYRCGFAAEKTYYLVGFPDGEYVEYPSHKDAKSASYEGTSDHNVIWSRKEVQPASVAIANVQKVIGAMMKKYEPKQVSLYLTGRNNFRDEIARMKEYKGNRDPAYRPKHYQVLRSLFINHGARVINGFEADDAIAAEAYSYKDETQYVVVSNDKDLDQVPGFHYDWTNGKEWYISAEDAMKVFYTQLLCGDPTDNIPGVMSEKKASEMIMKCTSPRQAASCAILAYKDKNDEWDFAQALAEVAELVWIKRSLKEGEDGFNPPINQHIKDMAERL